VFGKLEAELAKAMLSLPATKVGVPHQFMVGVDNRLPATVTLVVRGRLGSAGSTC
jgi:hypothetical protein